MSRVVIEHRKVIMALAVKVCFCTRPVTQTRAFGRIILSLQIVEMGRYCSFVSVMLGSYNFAVGAR